MNKWFTADYHLGHANIIKYCGRKLFMSDDELKIYSKIESGELPMDSLVISEESLTRMNEHIISTHNQRVAPTDIVFFLGDFCFRNTSGGRRGEGMNKKAAEWLEQLNGNFVFVQGNHDRNNSLSTPLVGCFIEMGRNRIYLCHKPSDCPPGYDICFCGHVHGLWQYEIIEHVDGTRTTAVNVGIDARDYTPRSYNEIMSALRRWDKKVRRESERTAREIEAYLSKPWRGRKTLSARQTRGLPEAAADRRRGEPIGARGLRDRERRSSC